MTENVQKTLFPQEKSIELPNRVGKTSIDYRQAPEILTRASGFVNSYDFTLNPYTGCSFGCSYCYAAFFQRDRARQESWGQWVTAKENAGRLMAAVRPGLLDGKRIYMSTVTDAYQPLERRVEITREVLENLADRHAPRLVVQTRSPLVTRDLDLFGQIEERGGRVQVNMTVTTDDDEVRRAFEPGCPTNAARLRAIRAVREAGIQTCITMTPLLLVRDAEEFAESLLATGCRRFIVQGFHFEEEKLIAQTREQAFRLMAEKLGCPEGEFRSRYLENYRSARDVLKAKLPMLGEGREGFRPPF